MAKASDIVKIDGRLDADYHVFLKHMIAAGAQQWRLMIAETDSVPVRWRIASPNPCDLKYSCVARSMSSHLVPGFTME